MNNDDLQITRVIEDLILECPWLSDEEALGLFAKTSKQKVLHNIEQEMFITCQEAISEKE